MNDPKTSNKFITIRKEIELLVSEEKILNEDLKIVQNKLKKLYKEFPRCFSCNRNRDPNYMVIVTQEDIDDYYDRNEGYCIPEIGEYYCGC